MTDAHPKQTIEKALKINLNSSIYGTVAEIGAGQEVARNFFLAGGAAGTIAKTMSAYDMQVSDAIYGEEKDHRYVSQSRVKKMVQREYDLVVERLQDTRSPDTLFFSFADTVAAKSFQTRRDCHGWMGIRFQLKPEGGINEIILHVRMKDNSNQQQQDALGSLGINLIYGAFYYYRDPEMLIESLVDDLGGDRVEIDIVHFSGPEFRDTDNRLMALHLVKAGLSPSVLFTGKGEPVQALDLLYKKNILVLRGSFRPVTNIHLDIIRCGREEILKDPEITKDSLEFITEISMSNLLNQGNLDKEDFLGRVDTLCKLGFNVQITNFARYFKLKDYLAQFSHRKIIILMGVRKIVNIFDEKYYQDLHGGILEALGILFSRNTVLYTYPRKDKNGSILSPEEMYVEDEVKYLLRHFLHTGKIVALQNYDPDILTMDTTGINDDIRKDDGDWKEKVPSVVYDEIRRRKLFGYNSI